MKSVNIKYLIFSAPIATFLEISEKFHNDWRWYDSASCEVFCLAGQIPILAETLKFTFSVIPVSKNKLNRTISCNKNALIIFYPDPPNSQVPGFNNFLAF